MWEYDWLLYGRHIHRLKLFHLTSMRESINSQFLDYLCSEAHWISSVFEKYLSWLWDAKYCNIERRRWTKTIGNRLYAVLPDNKAKAIAYFIALVWRIIKKGTYWSWWSGIIITHNRRRNWWINHICHYWWISNNWIEFFY